MQWTGEARQDRRARTSIGADRQARIGWDLFGVEWPRVAGEKRMRKQTSVLECRGSAGGVRQRSQGLGAERQERLGTARSRPEWTGRIGEVLKVMERRGSVTLGRRG